MNPFDEWIISCLNGVAHQSWTFDSAIVLIGTNYLIKGALVPFLIWWAWFRSVPAQAEERRILLLCGVLAYFPALAVSRMLSLLVPFRERPLRNPALHFQLPYGVNETTLSGWSSFPSDHAAVFFAVATCIYFVSRRAGIVALCHSFFVVCLTRVYMGIHYPTDILAGACIGVGIGCLSKNRAIQGAVARTMMPWLRNHPDWFYGLLFLLTFQIAVVFDPIREIVLFIGAVAKHVFKGVS